MGIDEHGKPGEHGVKIGKENDVEDEAQLVRYPALTLELGVENELERMPSNSKRTTHLHRIQESSKPVHNTLIVEVDGCSFASLSWRHLADHCQGLLVSRGGMAVRRCC